MNNLFNNSIIASNSDILWTLNKLQERSKKSIEVINNYSKLNGAVMTSDIVIALKEHNKNVNLLESLKDNYR
jgi:CBS-domain-containing membrane protein